MSAFGAFFVLKIRRAYRNNVATLQDLFSYFLAIDQDSVSAAPVNDASAIILRDNKCMTSADVLCFQLDIILLGTADSQAILEQREAEFLSLDRSNQQPGYAIANHAIVWFLSRTMVRFLNSRVVHVVKIFNERASTGKLI
jgi:hypothetical protein